MYIHQNIKYLRLKKKLNQTEFGAEFGLTRGKIYSYEGKIEPPISVISAFASYFGMTIDDLIQKDLSKSNEVDMTIKIEGHNNVIGSSGVFMKNVKNKGGEKEPDQSKKENEILKKEIDRLLLENAEIKRDKEIQMQEMKKDRDSQIARLERDMDFLKELLKGKL